jgi:hypothetical protein
MRQPSFDGAPMRSVFPSRNAMTLHSRMRLTQLDIRVLPHIGAEIIHVHRAVKTPANVIARHKKNPIDGM